MTGKKNIKNENNTIYIYNNEAISIVAIITVLEKLKQIDIAKVMLILPFLYHKRTLSFIEKTNIELLTLEEFTERKLLFANFQDRFLTYLPITINSLTILKEMKLIEIKNNEIIYKPDNKFDILNNQLGERVKNIVSSASKLSNLLREDTINLYYQLRIEL